MSQKIYVDNPTDPKWSETYWGPVKLPDGQRVRPILYLGKDLWVCSDDDRGHFLIVEEYLLGDFYYYGSLE